MRVYIIVKQEFIFNEDADVVDVFEDKQHAHYVADTMNKHDNHYFFSVHEKEVKSV